MKKRFVPMKPDPSQFGGEDFFLDTFFIRTSKISLVRQDKVQTIGKFILDHPTLFNRLKNISLLGFPADSVFGGGKLCNNISQQISTLFLLTCGIKDVQIAMDIDKVVSCEKHGKYFEDYTCAKHCWAEFSLNGKCYVADFSQQFVYFADDYYAANQHNPSHIIRASKADIELTDVVDAYVGLAKAILKYSKNQPMLVQTYQDLINNLSEYPVSTYCVKRLAQQLPLLAANNMPQDYHSDACLLTLASCNKFKTASINNLTDGSITPRQAINKIREVLNNKHGPKMADMQNTASQVLANLYPLTQEIFSQIDILATTGQLGE